MTLGPTKEWQEYVFRRVDILKGIDPTTGAISQVVGDELRSFFTQFRFKVTPLSSMPMNRIQRGLMAMQLANAGLIDGEEVLRTIEWPNYRAVLERAQGQQAQQKQEAVQMSLMGLDPSVVSGGGGRPPRSNRSGTKLKLG